jgi:hypothetical protein
MGCHCHQMRHGMVDLQCGSGRLQTVNESLRPPHYHKKPLSRRQSALADYYPLLSRAVSRLTVNHAQTRQELYEYARKVLVAELERSIPGRSPQAGLGERIEFETAVLKVEANSQLGCERSPETLLNRLHALRKRGNSKPVSEKMSDFASLLREPAEVWPAPARLRR